MLHLENVDRRDIHVNVLGINHFTWFDYAAYKGVDLFPVYREYIEEHYEEDTMSRIKTGQTAPSTVPIE